MNMLDKRTANENICVLYVPCQKMQSGGDEDAIWEVTKASYTKHLHIAQGLLHDIRSVNMGNMSSGSL